MMTLRGNGSLSLYTVHSTVLRFVLVRALTIQMSHTRRSAVTDGSGQYRITELTPGTYTVVLELFYPNYRGGTGPKGVYKPVSNVLTYQISAGAPPRITVVESPKKDGPAPKR